MSKSEIQLKSLYLTFFYNKKPNYFWYTKKSFLPQAFSLIAPFNTASFSLTIACQTWYYFATYPQRSITQQPIFDSQKPAQPV